MSCYTHERHAPLPPSPAIFASASSPFPCGKGRRDYPLVISFGHDPFSTLFLGISQRSTFSTFNSGISFPSATDTLTFSLLFPPFPRSPVFLVMSFSTFFSVFREELGSYLHNWVLLIISMYNKIDNKWALFVCRSQRSWTVV